MTPSEKAAQKKKRDLIITSILLVVFAFTFTKNVLLQKKAAPAVAAPTGPAVSTRLSDQLVFVTNMRLYDKLCKERVGLWEREWGRDPFVPQAVVGSIVKAVNLTLKGILWDEKTPKAIVNEKTLFKGDTIYGYTVIDIKPRSVILKTGEKNIELQVFHPVIAPPPDLSAEGGPIAAQS